MATWAEMPRSPGHAFYDRLQDLLREAGFDAFVEGACKPYYAPRMGAPSLPAGTVFPHAHDRLLRGHRQRAGHRVALRGLVLAARFPAAVERREGSRSFVAVAHALAFCRTRRTRRCSAGCWKLVAERGLVKGERIGVDGSTMEANAALRTIVRRDSGESYRAMLTRMAKESGIDTPSAEDLARFDPEAQGQDAVERRLEEPDRP